MNYQADIVYAKHESYDQHCDCKACDADVDQGEWAFRVYTDEGTRWFCSREHAEKYLLAKESES